MNYITLRNNETIHLTSIPELDYPSFLEVNVFSLLKSPACHCVSYFGSPYNNSIKLICCIANDETHTITVSSAVVDRQQTYPAFSAHHLAFEKFEREIHENYGIRFRGHPWLKPLRYAFDRFDQNKTMAGYPFFRMESEEFHEVGVGPIHAGIIEPGHFRFICNGEQILHLEIQLGYQHRGVERLFLEKKKLLQRTTLAENITGDTVVGHTLAFVNLWESLCNYTPDQNLQLARTLALELERIAVHTGDLSAMCTDIGYQLGSAVFGRLRTPVINFFQSWCGNRLAKGLIRAGKSNYPLTPQLVRDLSRLLETFEVDFNEMSSELFNLPSTLGRFEKTGILATKQSVDTGTVGLTARMSGINRDIRFSHPHDCYPDLNHQPVIRNGGDVYTRARLRKKEIDQSISYIRQLLEKSLGVPGSCSDVPGRTSDIPGIFDASDILSDTFAVLSGSGIATGSLISVDNNKLLSSPMPNSFTLSLVEGWRGEICHCAITGDKGELVHYKIKDPSFHNWLALALAVRNNEISDFPISNKSFNLSYCGHDL
jgi:Ni,Fe-hydrogenase III large subunit/NADH:ubiquinone oxidoreductase subunit C